jgi:hypothetical protein
MLSSKVLSKPSLSSKKCPVTGVVNFFDATDPYLSVGSVAKCGTAAKSQRYLWRVYEGGANASGYAPDLTTAKHEIEASYALFAESGERYRH